MLNAKDKFTYQHPYSPIKTGFSNGQKPDFLAIKNQANLGTLI